MSEKREVSVFEEKVKLIIKWLGRRIFRRIAGAVAKPLKENDVEKERKEKVRKGGGFISRHPVIANVVIIVLVAALGLWIAYISIALFTKHGQSDTVPGVEGVSYTQAISTLHDAGLNVDIRDSLYRDDIRPGYVIEQFPKAGSVVKPGRKVFLYINAVHPKEVVVDDNNNPAEYALRGISYRQGMARLQELGFKNIRVVKVLGDNDRIVKMLANGSPVRQMQKVPVNARIVLEISDGRLSALRDSLYDLERLRELEEESMRQAEINGYENAVDPYSPEGGLEPAPAVSEPEPAPEEEDEGVEYF